jgi:hypothetical protein
MATKEQCNGKQQNKDEKQKKKEKQEEVENLKTCCESSSHKGK